MINCRSMVTDKVRALWLTKVSSTVQPTAIYSPRRRGGRRFGVVLLSHPPSPPIRLETLACYVIWTFNIKQEVTRQLQIHEFDVYLFFSHAIWHSYLHSFYYYLLKANNKKITVCNGCFTIGQNNHISDITCIHDQTVIQLKCYTLNVEVSFHDFLECRL